MWSSLFWVVQRWATSWLLRRDWLCNWLLWREGIFWRLSAFGKFYWLYCITYSFLSQFLPSFHFPCSYRHSFPLSFYIKTFLHSMPSSCIPISPPFLSSFLSPFFSHTLPSSFLHYLYSKTFLSFFPSSSLPLFLPTVPHSFTLSLFPSIQKPFIPFTPSPFIILLTSFLPLCNLSFIPPH